MALALALAFAGAPFASAAEPTRPLSSAAAAKASRVKLSKAIAQDAPATSSSDAGGFFKSKKGVATLLLFAGALGYTIYSRSEDRVNSPAPR